jgi:hypothetical protein
MSVAGGALKPVATEKTVTGLAIKILVAIDLKSPISLHLNLLV